jgi:hypothetical protein
MKKYILIFSSLLLTFALFQSCSKDDDTKTEDEKLVAEATASGLTGWVRTPTVTAPDPVSIHGNFRIWFNSIAFNALDGSGNLPVGKSFPTGSLIVKTIYAVPTGPVTSYVVMKKDPGNVNVNGGYIWADFNKDGTINHSITEKGVNGGCVSCHYGVTPNRDLCLAFDRH